ncbi:MAG: cation:proton antiporter, partial [Chitinophagaceae bacterium]
MLLLNHLGVLLFDFSLPLKDPVLVFSLLLFIILLAPIILRKFRIPSIIGLIMAGVAIGPFGFNFLDGNLLQKGSSINLFGTVGLLYIMFLAGLELDLNEFIRSRNKSLLFGALTFCFPFSLGLIVCINFLHFSILASVLISSMFSTHTLVAYPIASRLGIAKNEAVTIAVGGTIITDTVVLLILAIISGSSGGGLTVQFWEKLGISLTIFCAIVFGLFPIIGRWFFKTLKGESVSHYIFVLAMVFLSASMAEVAGIDGIIGAFMAGLALNRLIPHTSPLMNRIVFVGNALFIPFFLLGVGMIVDLRILLKGPEALIVAGTLTLVAFSGKWLAAYFTQKIFGYSNLQRKVLFGLTSAHAAATLAVVLVGYKIGLVNEAVLNGTVILILVTCLVSSFVTESGGRQLALLENERIPEISEASERILVSVSNPSTIEHLMDLAVMLRDPRHKQPIYSLSVVKDDEEAREKVMMSNKILEKTLIHAAATDNKVEITTRVDLNYVNGISRAVTELMATDLVIGWNENSKTAGRLVSNVFGSSVENITQAVWQTIFISRLIHPLNTTKKMVLVLPQNVEFEMGFGHWVRKVNDLAIQTGAHLLVCASDRTKNSFELEIKGIKSKLDFLFKKLDELEDFLVLSREITKDDLLILVSARKKTLSYDNYLDHIPSKLMRYFQQNNFILLFPEQAEVKTLDG